MNKNTNGKVAQGANSQTETTKPELSNLVIAAPQEQTEKRDETKKPATIAERKHRTELLQSMFDRQEKYQETQRNLEKFLIGVDENSQKLSLTDSKGTSFATSNPLVIKPVLELVKQQVAAQMGNIEDDILNFII